MYSFYPTPTFPNIFPTQTPQTTQNIQYVSDKSSVESFAMNPNSSAVFMDSNKKRFYTKKVDASGVATIEAFDYKEAEAEKPVEYVTKAEFDKFKATMKGVKYEQPTNESRKQ